MKYVVMVYPIGQPAVEAATFDTFEKARSYQAEMRRQMKQSSIEKRED